MAQPQEFNVTQRRTIATLDDQHKYDMPDGRRLRVYADPLNMPLVVNEKGQGAAQLAQALAQIRPEIIEYATDRRAEEIAGDIQQGRVERIKGLPPDQQAPEWRQYGYEYQSNYLLGEDLGSKLEAEIQQKDPEVPFDEWYKGWWEANAQGVPNNPEHYNIFNRAFTKSLVAAKDFDTKAAVANQRSKEVGVATESIFRAVKEIRSGKMAGQQQPITMAAWDQFKKGLPGFSNPDQDAIIFEAVKRYAQDATDPEVLGIFEQERIDAKTGKSIGSLASNPKYTDAIITLKNSLKAKRREFDTQLQKQAEDTLAAKRNTIWLEMLKDPKLMENPDLMRKTFLEIATKNPLLFPPEDLIKDMNTELGYITAISAKVEGPGEELAALEIQANIGKYTPETIIQKVQSGKITPKQGSSLLTKLESHKQHLQTMANQAASNNLASRTFFVGQGHGIIKDAIAPPAAPTNPREKAKYDQLRPVWDRNQYLATIEYNDWIASQTKQITGAEINEKAVQIAEKYRKLAQEGQTGSLKINMDEVSPYIPKPDQKMTQQ